MDNNFKEQQAKGMVSESNRVLSVKYLRNLYESECLATTYPVTFICRLIFNVALATEMRPGELHKLECSQVVRRKFDGEDVIVITGMIGSTDGVTKNAKGGWRETSTRPKQIFIWNRHNMDGLLNVYKDISKYMDVRSTIIMNKEENKRLFAAINHKATSFNTFFTAQPLGEWTIRKTIQNACDKLNIVGLWTKEGNVTHGLRGMVTTRLVECNRAETANMQRTGHKQIPTLRRYQSLMSEEGQIQQDLIFGGDGNINNIETGNVKQHTNTKNKQNEIVEEVKIETTGEEIENKSEKIWEVQRQEWLTAFFRQQLSMEQFIFIYKKVN